MTQKEEKRTWQACSEFCFGQELLESGYLLWISLSLGSVHRQKENFDENRLQEPIFGGAYLGCSAPSIGRATKNQKGGSGYLPVSQIRTILTRKKNSFLAIVG